MDLIVRMKFGSHLYGTATEASDTDYKGIYMPSGREVLLGRVKKSISTMSKDGTASKNTAADVDEEIYSLHYFIELACQGQTVALDMLHAPDAMLTHTSQLWSELRGHRAGFYTKNLDALVGYARKQAAKYGVKGSRLAEAKMVAEALRKVPPDTRLKDIWNDLPSGEHIRKEPPGERPEHAYVVCGKMMIDTAKVGHYLPMLDQFIEEYGMRARQAEANVGVDWKAISHAFRAAYQVKAILVDGGFEYPLREATFLRQVKSGEIQYKDASPLLESLIDEVETLSAASTLPEKVDRERWDTWLANAVYGMTMTIGTEPLE